MRKGHVRSRVLLFGLAASFDRLLFGLLPALQLARPELQSFLKEGARAVAKGALESRAGGFVVAQVALSSCASWAPACSSGASDKLLE